MDRSNAAALADPRVFMDSPTPSNVNAAIKVVFFPRLRGARSYARSPFGARAYTGVKLMLELHSSITTS